MANMPPRFAWHYHGGANPTGSVKDTNNTGGVSEDSAFDIRIEIDLAAAALYSFLLAVESA